MGRRSSWDFQKAEQERKAKAKLNPWWRGVGCLLVIGFGLLGYLFATWFINQNAVNNWLHIPALLMNPDIPVIGELLGRGRMVMLIIGLLFLLIAFGIVNVAWAILFPVQPGELDVETPKMKDVRRKRRMEKRRKENLRRRF